MSEENTTPTVDTRYFMKRNPARPIVVGDFEFHFVICDYVAGAYRGVYKDEKGEMPDEAIYSKENKSGAAILISQDKYLQILQKKRPSVTNPEPVNGFREAAKPDVSIAEAEPVTKPDEVDMAVITGTGPAEPQATKSVVTNIEALSEATDTPVDVLKEYNKREESPGRSSKGYKVSDWIEYIASTQPSK